jgi:succinate-acetate transporter protein
MHKKAQPLHEFVRGDLVGYGFFWFSWMDSLVSRELVTAARLNSMASTLMSFSVFSSV